MERIITPEEILNLAQEARNLSSSILTRESRTISNVPRNRILRSLHSLLFASSVRVFNTTTNSQYDVLLRAKLPVNVSSYIPRIEISQTMDSKGRVFSTSILLSTRDPNFQKVFPVVNLLLDDEKDLVKFYPYPIPVMDFKTFMGTVYASVLTDLLFPCLRSIDNVLKSKEGS